MVDRQFLEFWGNCFLNAAQTQKHLEDMSRWIRGDYMMYEDITKMFTRFYGFDLMETTTPDYFDFWKKTTEDFQKSFVDFMGLMDFMPREETGSLARENRGLRDRIAELEKSIKTLQKILDEKLSVQNAGIKGFEDMLKDQTQKFQDMMLNYSTMFKDAAPTKSKSKAGADKDKSSTAKAKNAEGQE